MRRLAFAVLVVLLVLAGSEMSRRLLLASGGAGAFILPPASITYAGLYNGRSDEGLYDIGFLYSQDSGATFTKLEDPVITRGGGEAWHADSLVQPALLWNGSAWVAWIAGCAAEDQWRLGRWTNPNADLVAHPDAWTADEDSPLIPLGSAGAFDDHAMNLPAVGYDAEREVEQVWYAGWKSGGTITIGYAEREADGTITKFGQVLGVGASGAFDDDHIAPGAVVVIGDVGRLYYAGHPGGSSGSRYATALATFDATDPGDASGYGKQGAIAALTPQKIVGDLTWNSVHLRTLLATEGGWIGWGSVFHPTSGDGPEEAFATTSADGLTFTAPSGPIIGRGPTWDGRSAENPSIVVIP